MIAPEASPRDALRAHPLDGALLWFRPTTGLHVRVQTPATASLRRAAPRVVMFGLSHACNLRCGYCSRDTTGPSTWTLQTALTLLEGLDRAGVLEVAFGGGEPFVLPWFVDLVRALHERTRLAVHVTTNGTLLDEATVAALAGRVGVVRLSTHDEAAWRPAALRLTEAGVRWGANVLVGPGDLDGLPLLLDDIQRLGAADVSVLSYVGPDPALHLDRDADARLSEIVADSPLPARVSVCFGERLHAPLLPAAHGTSDCGAGTDFVSITAQGTVQACSFHHAGVPVRTAEDVLRAWQAGIGPGPSPRRGCARGTTSQRAVDLDGVRVWRAFAGNNSGECLLVARFEAIADADRWLATLLPGLGGEDLPASWKALFVAEGLPVPDEYVQPDELLRHGRTVFALGYDSEDAFAELRALAWRHGARVLPGGVHVHGALTALVAVAAEDGDDADALLGATSLLDAVSAVRHGNTVIVAFAVGELAGDTLADDLEVWRWTAGERPQAVTVVDAAVFAEALVDAAQRLGTAMPEVMRTWLSFRDAEAAEAFATRCIEGPAVRVDRWVLVEGRLPKRTLVEAYRRGGEVSVLATPRVRVTTSVWWDDPLVYRPVDPSGLAERLVEGIGPGVATEADVSDRQIALVTDQPGTVFRVLGRLVPEVTAPEQRVWVWLEEVDGLGLALRHVIDEVRVAGR